jgi:hypothetical protein
LREREINFCWGQGVQINEHGVAPLAADLNLRNVVA